MHKRFLVTGGAGFIGSHLVESLLRDNHEVICIDDLSSGKMENIEPFVDDPNFIFIKMDICSRLVGYYMDGIDVIFHNAASKKNICLKDPNRDLEVNAGGTLNLLQQAKKYDVKKFVHASTGSVYGEPVIFPQNEEHPLNPVSYYGVSKLAGERYVSVFNRLYELNTTILRYYHVYGTRQENDDNFGGVVSIFAKHIKNNKPIVIYGDGSQIRSFTDVRDVVLLNRLVADSNRTYGQVYNCVSGISVTIRELAEKMMKLYGRRVPIIYRDWLVGDIKNFEVDNNKAESLGFKFKTDMDFTLKEILKNEASSC